MNDFPWITVIGAVPLVGAALVAALPARLAARAKHIALAVSVLTLALVVAMALKFDPNGAQFQFTER